MTRTTVFPPNVDLLPPLVFSDYTEEVMNRFKGLDLVHKVPEELWMEVGNIVWEVVTKAIPKK